MDSHPDCTNNCWNLNEKKWHLVASTTFIEEVKKENYKEKKKQLFKREGTSLVCL